MSKPILVAGDSMQDEYVWGEVERISPEAPVPVVKVLRTETKQGAAGNVAANIEALGGKALLVAHSSCRKLRIIARSQHVCRVDFDQHAPVTSKILDSMMECYLDWLPECDFVILSDYNKGVFMSPVSWIVAAGDKKVLVDPKGTDYELYRGAYLIKPNVPELQAVIGSWRNESQLWRKVQDLLKAHDIQWMLLTRAGQGASLMGHGEKIDFPSQATEVYDVTGAGDTVIATLAYCLNEGNGLKASVRYAIKAAGITCRHLGTHAPTYKEVFND